MEEIKGTGLLVTHLERKSRHLRLGKLKDTRATTLSAVSHAVLGDLPALCPPLPPGAHQSKRPVARRADSTPSALEGMSLKSPRNTLRA